MGRTAGKYLMEKPHKPQENSHTMVWYTIIIGETWSAPADSKLCFRLTKTKRFNGNHAAKPPFLKKSSKVAFLWQFTRSTLASLLILHRLFNLIWLLMNIKIKKRKTAGRMPFFIVRIRFPAFQGLRKRESCGRLFVCHETFHTVPE